MQQLIKKSGLSFSLLIVLMSTACASKVTLDDIMTMSDAAKEQKLYQRVEHFNRARYWGSAAEALGFVAPEYHQAFIQGERERAEIQRIVRSEIASSNITAAEDKAEITIEVQYFAQPTYTVQKRKERLEWTFDRMNGGWLLSDAEVIDEGKDAEIEPALSRGRMRGLGSY